MKRILLAAMILLTAFMADCAHPKFRPAPEKYLKKASILTDQPAFPYSLEAANLFHKEEN